MVWAQTAVILRLAARESAIRPGRAGHARVRANNSLVSPGWAREARPWRGNELRRRAGRERWRDGTSEGHRERGREPARSTTSSEAQHGAVDGGEKQGCTGVSRRIRCDGRRSKGNRQLPSAAGDVGAESGAHLDRIEPS